jgi:hypothetical protein
VTVRDSTGLAGRPFDLTFGDLSYTTTRGLVPFQRRAWLTGQIVIRAAVEQDGFAYWNFRGPNSRSAADAQSDNSPIDTAVVRDPVLRVSRAQVDTVKKRVRVVEATPKVSMGSSPSIEISVRAETINADGRVEEHGHITVQPRETPWLFDEATGRWSELETFDLFTLPTIERSTERTNARSDRQRHLDIAATIENLAGLERLGQRIRAPEAAVEIDDEVVISLRSHYVPFRDGEAMGEESSLLSESLNKTDTGPVAVRGDVWVANETGRTQRFRIGHADELARLEDVAVKLDTSEGGNGRRLVISGLGQGLAIVRFNAMIEDQFGLGSHVSALASNFHVANAQAWVEAACGVSVNAARRHILEAAQSVRLGPTDSAIASVAMLRTVVEALTELDAHRVVPATRVAGAVRLGLRVQELLPNGVP